MRFFDILYMNSAIRATRSSDATRLKAQIGVYVALDPIKFSINPPINNGFTDKSHMGLKHPFLARMLCPVDYLKQFDEDRVK